MHTYIICEIGSNHDGSIEQARQMIKCAKNCGADVVKFQIFKAKTLYSAYTDDFDKYTNVYEMIRGLEVPWSFFKECYKICSDYGIEFLATPFDDEAVDFLMGLGVKRVKIASFEFSDARFVKYVYKTKLPIIASTGFASVDDINTFIEMTRGVDITLLHCNSAYPTPDNDVHLMAIPYLKQQFGTKVGYSDHSQGIIAPAIAVGVGACVIEKHFTLDKTRTGPDHPYAIEPNELTTMVKYIRQCEIMLGDNNLERTDSESPMMYAKRSVIANRFIPLSKIIEQTDITTKRPGSGIPAACYYNILGMRAIRDIDKDEILTYDCIGS